MAIEVRGLQLFLQNRGFDPGRPDGVLGIKTVSTLQRFLKANGFPELAADGVMGPKTQAAYAAATSRGLFTGVGAPVATGHGGDAQLLDETGFVSITELQQFLLGKGIAIGRADGVMGPKTRAGISQARAHGLFQRRGTGTPTVSRPGPQSVSVARPSSAGASQPRDIVVPIVFPDYAITVNSEQRIRDAVWDRLEDGVLAALDLVPGVDIGENGAIKSDILGHAGIAYANGETGFTRYWEYGRYDAAARGICRNVSVPDLKITPDFEPDPDSLNRLFARVSETSGGGTRVAACLCRVPRGASDKLEAYCRRVDQATKDQSFNAYSAFRNSCLHFVKRAMREAGLSTPPVVDPRPRGYIGLLQRMYPRLNWPDQRQDT